LDDVTTQRHLHTAGASTNACDYNSAIESARAYTGSRDYARRPGGTGGANERTYYYSIGFV